MTHWTVNPQDAGERLDRWLAARAGVSRGEATRWLEAGRVRVNSRIVASRKGGLVLRAGDEVVLDSASAAWIGPMAAALAELGRGDDWLAVDKPSGVPVHPLRPDEPGTLLGAVAEVIPGILGVGDEGELRSGVVHRLDVDTSGVVLFALTDARWGALREAFSEHRVVKRYRALVHGRVESDGRRTMHLKVSRHRPARVSVVDADTPQARACSLAWRVVGRGPNATDVEVDLHTGFLHQVRVMFEAMGHPLMGDAVYAPEAVAELAPRQMLHAASIVAGDIEAESWLPEDYLETRQRLSVST